MQQALGAAILAAALAALAFDVTRVARGRTISRRARLTPAGRRAAMILLSAGAALAAAPALFPPLRRGVFAICASCPVIPAGIGTATEAVATSGATPIARLLEAAWYYAATVLPIFVLACLLSGIILARYDRFRITGFWRSFGLAALLPLCSCGAVPLGRAIMKTGPRGRRDGLVFLAAAPLLSPVIIILAVTAIGPLYAALRVGASAILAFAISRLASPLLHAERIEATGGALCVRARGTSSALEAGADSTSSALEAGLDTLRALIRYALYGIAVGAAFTAFLPTGLLQAIIRPGTLSMAAAVLVGVPVNMCGGEEILLTAPLVTMGLGLGHAVAFALAGTGICLSSMPLLAAALGRRAFLAMVAAYLVVPFAIGIVVNAITFT